MPTTFNDTSVPTSARHEITPTLVASLEQKRVELSTTLGEIASLRQKEENLRTYITSTESLLLRIQPKPLATVFATPELMRLIFSFAQSSFFNSHHRVCDSILFGQKELRRQPTPISIATVCQQWRRIALAMPTLWSRIAIHTSGHSRATSTPYLRRLDLYLIRSAGQPLTISIEGAKRNVVLPFLFRLRAHEGRWKAVRLEIPPDLIETFLPVSSSILVALELSHGRVYPDEDDLLDPPEYIVSQPQPSIRSLSIDTSWAFKGAALPWQHLRTLRVSSGCRSFPMEAFEWCHQLEFLSIIQEEDWRASQHPLGRDVVHTRLERLQLMDRQEVLVFSELSLPSLHSLRFEAISNDDSDAQDFVQFISRSLALTTLCIFAQNWQRIEDGFEPSGEKHARELLDITSPTVQILEVDISYNDVPLSFLQFFRLSHLATHFPSLRELRLRVTPSGNPGVIHA